MGGKGDRPSLENRWWVDVGKDGRPLDRPPAKFGSRFFRSGAGFEQDRAQRRLTDLNLKWFDEVDAPPGTWGLIHALERERFPPQRLDKVKAALPLPADARGVLVDSGDSVRAIVTGVPFGARLIEVRLGPESSFDAWVDGEWVREAVFRNFDEGLRRTPALVREYLTTDRARSIGT
jgi:hypothetical protein